MSTDDEKQRKLTELEATIRRQDADHEARLAEITTEETTTTDLDETDADRLLLLDRLAKRMPDLDLDRHEIDWTRLDDGAEALVVDGGGFDGGTGYFIANAPDDSGDLHVVGSLAPLAPAVGCVVIRPDDGRVLAHVMPDPLHEQSGSD